jgi:hypothetical protein
MSVSFYPELKNDAPHIIQCVCGAFRGEQYANRQTAWEAMGQIQSDKACTECFMLTVEPAVAEPEVNMSNTNASEVLDLLGIGEGEKFSDRCVGSMSATELSERILIAEAFAPEDSGLTTMQIENIVYCGRPSDYIAKKLEGLREVAEWADKFDRQVVWG